MMIATLSLKDTELNQLDPLQFSASCYSYHDAEQQFNTLLITEELDQYLAVHPDAAVTFEAGLKDALELAYTTPLEGNPSANEAHLFLQRILYRINRLKLFWYDDLSRYVNERSVYLQEIRDRIESSWQAWELSYLDLETLQPGDVVQAFRQRAEVDLHPPLSDNKRYLREDLSLSGYRHLLAIASLDGLVEASRLSRILGGAANEVQCMLVRVFLEEYGNGRLARKHSTFFAEMMAELGLQTEPEAYFDWVPWEVLACINHNFLLTECKRHFLRYNGGLTYFEIAGPTFYTDYLLAAQRLGLSETAMGYWELHIREDERHGQWMLKEVALPLIERYPADAWQLVWGYDQEKWMGDRAGAAIIRHLKTIES